MHDCTINVMGASDVKFEHCFFQVLDQSYELGHFDLHKVPNHSVIIDTEDFKPPPRGKYEFDIVKRTPNPKKVRGSYISFKSLQC